MDIGAQVRKRRRILGLTMQDVVDQLSTGGVTLSKAAISKYENGKSVPKATTLRALARALDCSTDHLLAESTAEIAWLRFRRKTSLSKRLEVEIKETAKQWLQARLLVEEAIGERKIDLKLPQASVRTVEDAEAVSRDVRNEWAVGDWPLESIAVAMEKSGVIVVEVNVQKDLDGLSGIASGNVRFVVVAAGAPVDRMRMNLAHELGHIVIKPTEDEKLDDQAAFRFAASLIVPSSVVFDRIGRSRKTVALQELLLLKQEYGLSIQALIRRCYDLNVISEWTYKRLNIELRSKGWHRHEPGECAQLERPSQFQSHLLRCITEGTVSEKEIRTMFPEVARSIDRLESDSTWNWHGLRSMSPRRRSEILRDAAQMAAEEYKDGGSLADLELIDGDE